MDSEVPVHEHSRSDCVCCKTSDLAYLYTSCNRRTRRSRRRLAVLRPSASHATVRLSKADSLYRACPGANGAESEVRRPRRCQLYNTLLVDFPGLKSMACFMTSIQCAFNPCKDLNVEAAMIHHIYPKSFSDQRICPCRL